MVYGETGNVKPFLELDTTKNRCYFILYFGNYISQMTMTYILFHIIQQHVSSINIFLLSY